MKTNHIRKQIIELFESQNLAVLATQSQNQPYATLVAFSSDPSLQYIIFATDRNTRKFQNIIENSLVSLLIHNSVNQTSDFKNAIAVTVIGTASEIEPSQQDMYKEQYVSKHPYLKDFINSPTVSLIMIKIQSYFLVHEFQKVTEFIGST